MKTQFVADGFERYSTAQREIAHKNNLSKNRALNFFGKIRSWFQTKLEYRHEQKDENKSSPKILW